ncbi:MAG TPA: glycosyltransferase family 4 protein [Nitrosopumilaceae archaeon]|nr:glycosyltransferase family 4 protein [Nitrosopumilaceae archaeon]
MKTVFVKPRFNGVPVHQIYRQIQRNPPEGYNIIIPENSTVNRFSTLTSKNRSAIYKKILYQVQALPYLIYQLRDNVPIPPNTDLIYAAQHIITSEKPWVVDAEHASTWSGYSDLSLVKGMIAKKLRQDNCKKIIAWSEWAKRTIVQSFDDEVIQKKIQVVRYTTDVKTIQKKKKDSIIRFLFMGSANIGNMLNFEFKGFYETLEAFIRLQKEYGNKIQLVIKSKIPESLRNQIMNNEGIVLIENMISQEEIQDLYLTCDIFPHIGYEVMNLSVLEAMSYGLPTIATDIFNTSELIRDSTNGFLIRPTNIEKFYSNNELPNEHALSYLHEVRKIRSYMTEKLAEKMQLLIEDKKLRDKIGGAAKKTLEEGEFSITNRNNLLKNIFDNANDLQ